MTLAVLPQHIQLAKDLGGLAIGDGYSRLEKRRHTAYGTSTLQQNATSVEHSASSPSSLAAHSLNQSLEILRNHGNVPGRGTDDVSIARDVESDPPTVKEEGEPIRTPEAGQPAGDNIRDTAAEEIVNSVIGSHKETVAVATNAECHSTSEYCEQRQNPTAPVAGSDVIARERLFKSASQPCLSKSPQDGRSKRRSYNGRVKARSEGGERSSMNIPSVEQRRIVPHEYTPYFYLPHRTTYENDQDVSIVDQCLEDVCLRANYFELKQLAMAGFDFGGKSDERGNTALHYAAIRGDAGVVNLVLAEGGSVWARNNKNQTPFELASNLPTAMLLADSTLFYSEARKDGYLTKTKVCYEL